MLLGFLAHGYATGEFEVTEERLAVYLPIEHIDNPKVRCFFLVSAPELARRASRVRIVQIH